MMNDEGYEPAFLRHSTFIIQYSIFLFGPGLSGLWEWRNGKWVSPQLFV